MHFVLAHENCFTYTLQSNCRRSEIFHPLICFTILLPKFMTDLCVLLSLFFLITFLFFDFGFILPVLFDRSVSVSLNFSIVISTLSVFITDIFKSVLLCESFCFTGRVFSSILRNSFFSCRLTVVFCVVSLFFESWSVNELMILSLFLSCSLRNDICSSRWFINLSDVLLVEFA